MFWTPVVRFGFPNHLCNLNMSNDDAKVTKTNHDACSHIDFMHYECSNPPASPQMKPGYLIGTTRFNASGLTLSGLIVSALDVLWLTILGFTVLGRRVMFASIHT